MKSRHGSKFTVQSSPLSKFKPKSATSITVNHGTVNHAEIQLTDALRLMVKTRAVYGLRFDGVRYDIGNKLDFIKPVPLQYSWVG